nr:WYL domain-containing protein [Corynebacterium xerosis]
MSLLAALADDPAGLRGDWILRTVRGYNTVSEESAARYLRDDVPALAAAGIRVEWDARNATLTLDRSSFRTDDPGFTEEESEALAMASLVAFDDDSLKDLTTGAWAKLAPIARRSNLADDRGTVIFGDRVSLDGTQFADLTRAIQPPRKRVEFYFAPQLFAEEVLRTIEPWAIVNLKGRWYVVGHDVDRDDVRTFRMTRMVDVTVTDATPRSRFPRRIFRTSRNAR